jgi:hypothetical protein
MIASIDSLAMTTHPLWLSISRATLVGSILVREYIFVVSKWE